VQLTFLLVGDSTVTDGEGWAPGFRSRLRPGVECHNFARGGRSSKSFRDEGHWAEALRTPGDHVLIQFGHNDEPGKGPERETDPDGEYAKNIGRYVDEARDAGLKPIVLTSLCRRTFHPDGTLKDSLAPYAAAARRVAADRGVPLADLHAASMAVVLELGPDASSLLGPVKPDGDRDRTHLLPEGAEIFGGLVADLVRPIVPEAFE
jgi:lysophospholipase L1-like esterase